MIKLMYEEKEKQTNLNKKQAEQGETTTTNQNKKPKEKKNTDKSIYISMLYNVIDKLEDIITIIED